MERANFLYKSYISFTIVSDVVEPDFISNNLVLTPDRSFKKGEKTISKNSGSIITRPHNLWEISSKPLHTEEESISPHIEFLKSVLMPKKDILTEYKKDSRFEISFWIWVETDNAGIGMDLSETDLLFLNKISNRVHISLITRSSIASE